MFEIIAAIKSKYSATPALTNALVGGMHFRKHPRTARATSVTMPYAIFTVDADGAEENTGSGYVQHVGVTFEIYAKLAADFQTAAEAIKSNFFRQPLTLSAGKVIAAELQDEGIDDLETDDDTEPQVYYTITIQYTQTQTRA